MPQRSTTVLLTLVAFVGGLLAMVLVARWQPGGSGSAQAEPAAAETSAENAGCADS